MSFRDWLHETATRFQRDSVRDAAVTSAIKLGHGVERRVGARVGWPIWEWGNWDVCIVLDACRVDLLREVVDEYDYLPDTVDSRWSAASCSADWIERHCDTAPRPASTGLITANPFTSHAADWQGAPPNTSQFTFFDEMWRDRWRETRGIRTVTPEDMATRTVRVWRERDAHGVDQLVSHWMQPHQPFRARPEWWSGDGNLANLVDDELEADICVWQETHRGAFDEDDVWRAYRDNLRWALDSLAQVVENVDGRVLITADHGNGMGEWWTWGHPPGALAPPVRKVPAVTLNCTDEQTWSPAPLDRDDSAVEATVEDRLEALGYA